MLLPATAPLASLDIEVTGLRSAKGVLQLCITTDAADFPDCRNSRTGIKRTISAAAPRVRFEGLPPGDYAIAVIHDANRNARLDTMLGVPREGFGFSRNPVIRFGAPRFAATRFTLGAGAAKQSIRMRYLL